MTIRRREFLTRMAALAAAAGYTQFSFGDDDDRRRSTSGSSTPGTTTTSALPATGINARVVVVGGGMAGATVAKFLRLWGGSGVQVTLVEKEPRYVSNILSNLVLTDAVTMSSLEFSYATLVANYGITLVQGTALAADPVTRQLTVATATGPRQLPFDRLVVAPGIDFAFPAGLETEAQRALAPHAWQAGPQTTLLRSQIRAMRTGGTFVMTVPATPYRCPPGPYERACVVADWLKRNKPGSKVLVLDANADIAAERDSFRRAFTQTHAGVIEYVPNAAVERVDTAQRKVFTSLGEFGGDVLNVIPTNVGPGLLSSLGLASAPNGFAGVDVLSYESNVARGIHVIGDASATTQPKAGHIGNQEAKVCADAILRTLAGGSPDPAPVTNSSCYSPITASTASFLTAVFGYDPATRTMKVVPGATGEALSASKDHYEDMFVWFRTLMRDSFA
ncbi:MAG TPA: FAD/NAD(P)-binding oxidoreductase [Usitatibacteraceae bacterium]|nr:FAD/NAD(P)-binding oxidoreductase [Usitatibacteraceae bacterium]